MSRLRLFGAILALHVAAALVFVGVPLAVLYLVAYR